MSHKNQIEMSSFESLSIDRDPWSREAYAQTSHEQTKPPTFGFSKYSTLNSTTEDPFPQSTTTTASSFQDPRARDVVESIETLIQGSTSRGLYPKKLHNPGPPKKVCSKGIWKALGHLTLFHLPSVGINLAILALYIAWVRWPHPTVEQLSILQFVAKGHGILILVSLADILMYRVCYGLLVDKNGVPLGFLSSPFQLGAPILYLFSWELWSAILQPGANRSRGRPRITGCIIITVILLSLAAAPLSAIAIIPREGWQQVHRQPHEEEIITCLNTKLYETDLDSKHVGLYRVHAYSQLSQQDLLRMLILTIFDPPDKEHFSSSRRMANFTYTKLGSVGGGVESSQTWNTTAAVRVVGDERRIEMMLRQRGRGMGKDQQLEEGADNERGVTRVQPDIKYH
ncbi:hypothetical protein MRS44_015331 [Fusarium solani]|uniref:uncharacterized protein n=1 Tax=Fusarium solani TaxID=169388 RepID=UPI0032C4769E|nr:hypothetical protein MRS44_015331 [Fusarium solani]